MEKKSGLLIIFTLAIFLTINFVFADTNSTSPSDRAYSCLTSQLGNNCGGTQNTEQAAFSLMATSYDSNIQSQCKKSLQDKEQSNCWGETSSSSCDIKSTSLAILALKNIGANVDDSITWLLDRRKSATGLTWYLEIDSNNQTSCSINGVAFTILSNKQIGGSNPSGLIKSYNNYWFQITDISKNFIISCDKPFVTTLLYQIPGSSTVHISSETHSAASGDSTEEQVNSYCFSNSNVCDYEGSLWASLALQKVGQDTSPYLPYLSAMADDSNNIKYLPYSFLALLDHSDDTYQIYLTNQQQEGKYWQESGNKFYDTAIAILALRNLNTAIVSNTKAYLLTLTEPSGCWSSDTAFLLYAGWMKDAVFTSGSGGETSKCEDFNYACTSRSQCDSSNILNNFMCSGTDVCCKVIPQQQKCSDKQGMVCDSNQQCTGNSVVAKDTQNCCLGSCVEPQNQTNDCQAFQYSCKASCSSGEEEKTNYDSACTIGQKCCGAKTSSGPSSSWIWITLLAILIILLIVAIVFRNKLKIWLFKFKSGFSSKPGPAPVSRPSIPPTGFRPMPTQSQRPRQFIPRQPIQQPRPAIKSNKDKEFEDTMKKLRDMSK